MPMKKAFSKRMAFGFKRLLHVSGASEEGTGGPISEPTTLVRYSLDLGFNTKTFHVHNAAEAGLMLCDRRDSKLRLERNVLGDTATLDSAAGLFWRISAFPSQPGDPEVYMLRSALTNALLVHDAETVRLCSYDSKLLDKAGWTLAKNPANNEEGFYLIPNTQDADSGVLTESKGTASLQAMVSSESQYWILQELDEEPTMLEPPSADSGAQSGNTCYAWAISRALYQERGRLMSAATESLGKLGEEKLRNSLIDTYTEAGGDCNSILRNLGNNYRFVPSEVTVTEALNLLEEQSLVATLNFSQRQWERFKEFFRQDEHASNTLTKEILGQNDGLGMCSHAVAVVAVNSDKTAFRIHNSWGDNWADNGHAWLSVELAFQQLLGINPIVQKEWKEEKEELLLRLRVSSLCPFDLQCLSVRDLMEELHVETGTAARILQLASEATEEEVEETPDCEALWELSGFAGGVAGEEPRDDSDITWELLRSDGFTVYQALFLVKKIRAKASAQAVEVYNQVPCDHAEQKGEKCAECVVRFLQEKFVGEANRVLSEEESNWWLKNLFHQSGVGGAYQVTCNTLTQSKFVEGWNRANFHAVADLVRQNDAGAIVTSEGNEVTVIDGPGMEDYIGMKGHAWGYEPPAEPEPEADDDEMMGPDFPDFDDLGLGDNDVEFKQYEVQLEPMHFSVPANRLQPDTEKLNHAIIIEGDGNFESANMFNGRSVKLVRQLESGRWLVSGLQFRLLLEKSQLDFGASQGPVGIMDSKHANRFLDERPVGHFIARISTGDENKKPCLMVSYKRSKMAHAEVKHVQVTTSLAEFLRTNKDAIKYCKFQISQTMARSLYAVEC